MCIRDRFQTAPPKVSLDGGQSWKAYNANGSLLAAAFFDMNHALGLFMVDRASWSGTQELRASSDGGQTWSVVNQLKKSPCDVRSIRQDDKLHRIICVFNDGSIYSSSDSGEWALERPVE